MGRVRQRLAQGSLQSPSGAGPRAPRLAYFDYSAPLTMRVGQVFAAPRPAGPPVRAANSSFNYWRACPPTTTTLRLVISTNQDTSLPERLATGVYLSTSKRAAALASRRRSRWQRRRRRGRKASQFHVMAQRPSACVSTALLPPAPPQNRCPSELSCDGVLPHDQAHGRLGPARGRAASHVQRGHLVRAAPARSSNRAPKPLMTADARPCALVPL